MTQYFVMRYGKKKGYVEGLWYGERPNHDL